MSEMGHQLDKPSFIRVLIIDDQICSGRETISAKAFQEVIAAYIRHLVMKNTGGQIRDVDICFAGTPEDGVNRWKNEIFDLTLVDSDLKSSESTPKDKTEIQNFLDIIPSLKGAYIFRLLWDLMSDGEDDNPYKAYRDGCRVVFWTGLRAINDDGRLDKLNKILAPCFESSHWFIPKRKDDNECQWANVLGNNSSVTTLEDCIQESIEIYANEISWRSLLARYITLYRVKSPNDFQRITDFSEWVEQGYLYVENGSVFFSDSRPDGKVKYVELSPRLRHGNPSFKSLIEGDSQCVSCDERIPKDKSWRFPKESLATTHTSTLVAAATPLTGCSAIGKERAIDLMVDKVAALLNGPFGQVVLKTVYLDSLDQWDNLHWPTLQAQSHHRTRCLRSIAHPRTLWNTGITALESFTPEMMHKFLQTFASNDAAKRKRTIVSLGSKYPQWDLNERIQKRNEEGSVDNDGVKDKELRIKHYRDHAYVFPGCIADLKKDLEEIWRTLFEKVFSDELKGNNQYPIVEINVRHYLRECVAFHLGGHEYLSPAKIDPDRTKNELDFTGCYQSLDLEFNTWLEVLDEVAKNFDKKLLLKLPFRGDLLHFIRLIRDYVKVHEGTAISGITLINAFKSGAVEPDQGVTYSPAWYGRLDAWHDAADRKWTYQMSGELLAASRNELLGEVLNLVKNSGLDAHISGGIVDAEGIRYCSPVVVQTSKCKECGACKKVCDHGAITVDKGKTPAIIDQSKCVSCRKCIDKCPARAIGLPVQIGTWALMDLNLGESKWLSCANVPPSIGNGRPMVTGCQKCNTCYVQCQSKAFLKGSNDNAARIDIGKCVECKECLRMCPHGAITLGIDKIKTMNHADDEAPISLDKRINPRIAFCLHELCNGCGKCSRTFYCDTFMDRRGLELPPVMDSRNCTGCGLCVQTCPRGAIQLFKPEHVAVLIGAGDNLTAWHRRLTAYEIPHLVYEVKDIEDDYRVNKQRASGKNATDGQEPLEQEIFEFRKLHDAFFDKLSKDYTDDRDWTKAEAVLKKTCPSSIFRKWLFLAWSDPGQVLKNSPIIYATDGERCEYFEASMDCPQQTDCESLLDKERTHQGMREIMSDVNNRLKNLREVR